MAHIAHQPGPVCLEGGGSRWLVGVVGFGAELHPRPHPRRVGRFFHSSGLVKRAVPGPSGAAPEGYARGVWAMRIAPHPWAEKVNGTGKLFLAQILSFDSCRAQRPALTQFIRGQGPR